MAWGRPSEPKMTSAGIPLGPSSTRNTTPVLIGSSSKDTKSSLDRTSGRVFRFNGCGGRTLPGRAAAFRTLIGGKTAGATRGAVFDCPGCGDDQLTGGKTAGATGGRLGKARMPSTSPAAKAATGPAHRHVVVLARRGAREIDTVRSR